MTQDWAAGDFSTVIDGKSRWVAFGVSFDLDGVLELVPLDRRARLRLSLSVASDPAWITGLEARRIIHERGGVLETATAGVLIDKCQLGFVPARAVLMQQWTRPDEPSASIGRREWDVPRWFWTDFTSPPHWKADWQRGSFEGHGRRQDKSSWIRLTDTRFQKDALAALYPPPPSDLGPVKNAANKGGRPREPFWEDLWCEILGQISSGELHPKTQADLITAMDQWLINKGHNVGSTAVRDRARKALEAYQREPPDESKPGSAPAKPSAATKQEKRS